jgi:hypothetical protein
MTITQRLNALVGTFADTAQMQQFLTEACRQVIAELPEEVLLPLASELTDAGSGVSVAAMRVLDAHKLGYKAEHIDALTRVRIVASTHPQAYPVWYMLGTTAYVEPDGGTVLAITVPALLISDSTAADFGCDDMLADVIIARAASLIMDHMMQEARDAMGTTITLPTVPTPPSAPTISYTDATATSPSTVTIAALPTAPAYTPPSLAAAPAAVTVGTLDLTKEVDGVTSLDAPTAPVAPVIAYVDATATSGSASTIGALPTVPTLTPPTFGGSLTLPTLPTALDLTKEIDGVTALDPPAAPAAPVIAAVDAAASSVVASTLAALGTAPAYTKPTFAGSLALPTLPTDLNLSTVTIPLAPAAPTIAAVDAATAAVVATAIGALPAPPTFTAVVFGGALAYPVLPTLDVTKEVDGVTALDPPAVPTAPVIAAVDAAASSVVASTLAALGTAPAYTKPTFGGSMSLPTLTLIDVTKKADGVTALTIPALAAPAIAASDAAAATVTAVTVGSIGLVPTYSAPALGGSLGTLPTINAISVVLKADGITALNPPAAITTPALAAVDAVAASVVATSITALYTTPSYTKPTAGGTLATLPTLVTIDLSKKLDTATLTPPALADLAITYGGAAASTVAATGVGGVATIPTYTAPTWGGTVASPTLTTVVLDFTKKVDGVTALEAATALPGEPAVVYSAATFATFATAGTIGGLPTTVTLTESTFGGYDLPTIVAAIPAAIDLVKTFDNLPLTMDAPPTTPSITSGGMGAITAIALGTAPNYTKVAAAIAETDWETYFDGVSGEDPEMMAEIVRKFMMNLENQQILVADEWNEFQKEAEVYRATLQMNTAQAQVTLQELSTELTQVDRVALENYALKLQQHGSALAVFQANVATRVQAYQATCERHRMQYVEVQSGFLDKYRTNAGEKMAAFNGAVQQYQTQVERTIQQARIDQERLVVLAQLENDVNLRNAAQAQSALFQDYEGTLGRHRDSVAKWQGDVNQIFQKWEIDFRKLIEPWVESNRAAIGKYQIDAQAAADALMAQIEKFKGDNQKTFDQAQITLQEAIHSARNTTDVNMQNAVKTMEALLGSFQVDQQVFESLVIAYELEAKRVLDQWNAKYLQAVGPWEIQSKLYTEQYAIDVQNEWNEFQSAMVYFQADATRSIELARTTLQEALMNAQNSTEVANQNKARALQGIIADFEADVAVYQSALSTYEADISRVIAKWNADYQKAWEPYIEQQRLYSQQYAIAVEAARDNLSANAEKFRGDVEKVIQQAQADAQTNIAQANLTTDIAARNKANTLAATIADWEADVAVFQASYSGYEGEIGRVIEKWKLDYQKTFLPWIEQQRMYTEQYSLDIQNEKLDFDKELAIYQTDAQHKIEAVRTILQEAVTNAQNSTEVALRNKAQTLAGAIRDWEADVEVWQTGLARYNAEMDRVIKEWQLDFQKAMEPYVQGQQMWLQKYVSDLQQEAETTKVEVVDYELESKRLMEQAQVTLQEALANARNSVDVNVQNEAKTLEGVIADWQAEVQVYEMELTEYRETILRLTRQFELNLQKAVVIWADQQRLYVEQYNLDIQNERNEFEKELVAYQTDAQHKIEAVRTILQEAIANAQNSTEVAVRNKAQTLAALIRDWEADVERFQMQIATYKEEVTRQLDEFDRNFMRVYEPWKTDQELYLHKQKLELDAESASFSGKMQDHQLECERLIQQAQLDQQRLLQDAAIATDVSKQNELQTMAALLGDYQMELARYQAMTELYQVQVQAVVAQYSTKLELQIRSYEAQGQIGVARYQSEVANAKAVLDANVAAYQAGVERNALAAQILRQEYQQIASQATEVSVVNKAKTMEALIADYELELRLYGEAIKIYGTKSEALIMEQKQLTETISAKLRMMNFERQRLNEYFMRAKQAFLRFFWPHRTITVQQHPI